MGEQVKFIIQELNKAPYNKKFNLISFDALRPDQILQVLNDVFSEIDKKMKVDVRAEDPEQMALRILNFLRILKYKPPPDVELTEFRQGIVSGEKPVIYHILDWLLSRIPDLKKRAYLAQYLVKIDIPPDIEGDADISDLYDQYNLLIEDFKEAHKQCENLRASGFSTQEIRKDLEHMEGEREQLTKKIDRLKMKVETHPNVEAILMVARNLREERDIESGISRQKIEQNNALNHAEQKMHRLTQQLKELKHSNLGASPETLLQKLEEEVKVNGYMVNEKLPKEISTTTNYVQDLEKVISEPAMGQLELDQIKDKIQKVNAEINKLVEKRMMSIDPIDDKLSLFRQQASIISRKKEKAAEELNGARNEISKLQEQIADKQTQTKEVEGEVLKGDEFKRYINKLRGKSNVYKKKRQEIAELRAECGVLSRSVDILQQKDANIISSLAQLEDQKGVSGFHATQEELEKVSSRKAEIDEQKGQTLEEMSAMVRRLNGRIAEKKARLAPVIKELRPLRQQCQDMTFEYDQKKSAYDACALSLESNVSKLEQQVNSIKEDISANESRVHWLKANIQKHEVQEKQVEDEIKCYISSDPVEKKKSMRDNLNRKIQEQETQTKVLREHQKEIKENQATNEKQMKLWTDLQILLECKKRCREQNNNNNSHKPYKSSAPDHLIL